MPNLPSKVIQVLTKAFEKEPKPSLRRCKKLAEKTGLKVKQVNSWFKERHNRGPLKSVGFNEAQRKALLEARQQHGSYLSSEECTKLAGSLGLTILQVRNWFYYQNRKINKSKLQNSKTASKKTTSKRHTSKKSSDSLTALKADETDPTSTHHTVDTSTTTTISLPTDHLFGQLNQSFLNQSQILSQTVGLLQTSSVENQKTLASVGQSLRTLASGHTHNCEMKILDEQKHKRLDELEAKLACVDKRFETLETKMTCMGQWFDSLQTRMSRLDERFGTLETTKIVDVDSKSDSSNQTRLEVAQVMCDLGEQVDAIHLAPECLSLNVSTDTPEKSIQSPESSFQGVKVEWKQSLSSKIPHKN